LAKKPTLETIEVSSAGFFYGARVLTAILGLFTPFFRHWAATQGWHWSCLLPCNHINSLEFVDVL